MQAKMSCRREAGRKHEREREKEPCSKSGVTDEGKGEREEEREKEQRRSCFEKEVTKREELPGCRMPRLETEDGSGLSTGREDERRLSRLLEKTD